MGATFITPNSTLTKRSKADPKVYKRYAYIAKGTSLTPDDEVEILLRKNGKVTEYEHRGSFQSVGGHLVKYNTGDLIEPTLEHCIENHNLGKSKFKWMKGVTIDVWAKEANIHPHVLEEIIVSRYYGTRACDDLQRDLGL
jgi:hypothetical protein